MKRHLLYMRLHKTMQERIFIAKLRGISYTSCNTQSPLSNTMIRKAQPRLEVGLKKVYVNKNFLAHKMLKFLFKNEQDKRVILSIFSCVFLPSV